VRSRHCITRCRHDTIVAGARNHGARPPPGAHPLVEVKKGTLKKNSKENAPRRRSPNGGRKSARVVSATPIHQEDSPRHYSHDHDNDGPVHFRRSLCWFQPRVPIGIIAETGRRRGFFQAAPLGDGRGFFYAGISAFVRPSAASSSGRAVSRRQPHQRADTINLSCSRGSQQARHL
jgi:hypothetical protein